MKLYVSLAVVAIALLLLMCVLTLLGVHHVGPAQQPEPMVTDVQLVTK